MKVHTQEISLALRKLGKANRRGAARNINLAGRLMASFAYKDTREAGASKIRSYMERPARNPEKRRYASKGRGRKASSQIEGTVAAAIIGARHRKRGIRVTVGKYRQEVRQFIRQSERSSGYHKAGHIPALRAFRARGVNRRRGVGRFRQPIPGRARAAQSSNRDLARATMENFARGIRVAQPNVYRRQEGPVARQLRKFANQDIIRNAKRAKLR